MTVSGTPVGTQVPGAAWMASGCLLAVTRIVPDVTVPVTHGPLPAGAAGSGQPAIVHGALSRTTAWPADGDPREGARWASPGPGGRSSP